MDALLLALQFLTRIPLPFSPVYGDQALGRSALFYPLIGLLLGALLSVLALALSTRAPGLVAAVLLAAWVLLTGGLHLDGLADCADAWVGGLGDRQRSLKIMKDPTSGPIAVSVLVLLLLLKWSALNVLLAEQRWLPLLMIPMLGRGALLLLMLSTPYVSSNGLAAELLQHLPFKPAFAVIAVCALLSLLTLGGICLIVSALTLFYIRRLAIQRLGGATGDVYGACVEICEATALLAVSL